MELWVQLTEPKLIVYSLYVRGPVPVYGFDVVGVGGGGDEEAVRLCRPPSMVRHAFLL